MGKTARKGKARSSKIHRLRTVRGSGTKPPPKTSSMTVCYSVEIISFSISVQVLWEVPQRDTEIAGARRRFASFTTLKMLCQLYLLKAMATVLILRYRRIWLEEILSNLLTGLSACFGTSMQSSTAMIVSAERRQTRHYRVAFCRTRLELRQLYIFVGGRGCCMIGIEAASWNEHMDLKSQGHFLSVMHVMEKDGVGSKEDQEESRWAAVTISEITTTKDVEDTGVHEESPWVAL
mmetsp:Transcript_33696/g.74207  ORF Transcript_33696/g.74207 Transcript_33696/m.74207 type:complete len:235 (+) Transcript_33696:318-1022(+)